MQLGHHHLRRRHTLFFVQVDRNAAAVVDDRDRIVFVDGDVDLSAIAGERFVNRIVHDFVNQVVQSHLSGRTDVHRGPQSHRLQTLEHFDAS